MNMRLVIFCTFLVSTLCANARTITIINKMPYTPIVVRQLNIMTGRDLQGNLLHSSQEVIDKAKNVGVVEGSGQLVLNDANQKEVTLEFVYLPDDPEAVRVPLKVPADSQNECIELTWPGILKARRVNCK